MRVLGRNLNGRRIATTFSRPSLTLVVSVAFCLSAPGAVSENTRQRPQSYNLIEFCSGTCETEAEQTTAFQLVAEKINRGSGGTLEIPPGSWHYDSRRSGPLVFSTYGASIVGAGTGTTTVSIDGGSFAVWTVAIGFVNGGHGSLSNLRLYENDNPTIGSQILLDRVNGFEMTNVWLGGGFVSLDLASAVAVHGINVTIEGDNSTPEARLMRVHRTSADTGHSAENNFANLNVRGGAGRSIDTGILIGDSDGLTLVGGHVGFVGQDALLIKPEYDGDVIDNFHSIGVDYDTAAYGVRIDKLDGSPGAVSNCVFVGGLAELMDNDGVRVENPGVAGLVFDSFSTLRNGGYGINIDAGSHITLNGGDHAGNNQNNIGASHLRIGGNANYVAISGMSFRRWKVPVLSNIKIEDSADFVSIGAGVFSGASSVDVQSTTRGKHVSISPFVSDKN